MKYGVREICDVVLKARSIQKIGNKIFYKDEPVLYFDSLKTSSLEGAATTVYAQGGRGNTRLMAWEGERTLTFNMEDALISPESLAILTGADIIEANHDVIIEEKVNEFYEHLFTYNDIIYDGINNTFYIQLNDEDTQLIEELDSRGSLIVTDLINASGTTVLTAESFFNSKQQILFLYNNDLSLYHLLFPGDIVWTDVNYTSLGVVGIQVNKGLPENYSMVDGWTISITVDGTTYNDVYASGTSSQTTFREPDNLTPESTGIATIVFHNPGVDNWKFKVNKKISEIIKTETIIPKQTIITHITETTDKITKNSNNINITLKNIPSASNNAEIYVMPLKANEILTEPYIGIRTEGSKVISLKTTDDLDYFNNCDAVLVDYYTDRISNTMQIDITPDKFGGTYYLEASTLFKDTNGTDVAAEFIIPKCKIQSNFTFTMASSGDPSTFNFVLDAFPEYTRFDKTKKVLAAIQIINSNKNDITDNVRKSTPAKGV